MHPAATSIKVFGVYAMLAGIGLMLVPALVLAPLGIAPPTEVWVRMVGALAAVLGYYYWASGRAGLVAFFEASVRGRLVFAVLVGLLVVAFGAPPPLLVFGAIDLAGAAWTAQALRRVQ